MEQLVHLHAMGLQAQNLHLFFSLIAQEDQLNLRNRQHPKT
ncbi:Uncharacterised protein [Chlamydia trachomatis]|nr:Uncharacterised protein [Chlamydia trachomatis]